LLHSRDAERGRDPGTETSLYLFGSAAHNEAGEASDLDLTIDYDPGGKI
jgi:predicted nucleotidyltransferase